MSGNPLTRLRGLLPADTVQIGTVQSAAVNGTLVVLLIGGGLVTVTGSGFAPGSRVFVKGGDVVSAAPALSSTQIDV